MLFAKVCLLYFGVLSVNCLVNLKIDVNPKGIVLLIIMLVYI